LTLAEIVFEKKKLYQRYGVEGYVAGRYVEAGYNVTMKFATPKGAVSFVARRGQELLAVDVLNGSVRVTKEHVDTIAEKASSIGAKPVLALYGSGPRLGEDAKKAASEKGVALRRFR